MLPVAFIDDDESLSTRTIAGLKVYHPDAINNMIKETGAKEILLAMPSATRSRRREVLDFLEPYSLRVRTIPGFIDLACGKVQVQDIQEVEDRKSTRLNSSHVRISYAVFCLKKK